MSQEKKFAFPNIFAVPIQVFFSGEDFFLKKKHKNNKQQTTNHKPQTTNHKQIFMSQTWRNR